MNKSTETKVEKLNFWDRLFNRTRKTIVERGSETWNKTYSNSTLNQIHNRIGQVVPNSEFNRDFVVYKITDRVTGSEMIKKKYLN